MDLRTAPDAAIPGLLIVRPDQMLFFANVASVRERASSRLSPTPTRVPTVVLLDLGLTPEVDVPVVEALEHLHQRLGRRRHRALAVPPPPRRRATSWTAPGCSPPSGPDRIHPRVLDGIVAFALRTPAGKDRIAALTDVLAFIRERAARPGLSADAAELLTALEERLSLELSAATGGSERVILPTTSDSPSGRGPT